MKLSYFFIFVCLFCSCSSKCPECDAGYRTIGSFSKKMTKSNNWYLNSLGGSFNDTIRQLGVKYSVYQNADLSQTRMILVPAISHFVEHINADSNVQPYLQNSPFGPKGVFLGLMFLDKDDEFVSSDDLIAYAFIVNGIVYYSRYDKIKKTLIDVHQETFEEAIKIVADTKNHL